MRIAYLGRDLFAPCLHAVLEAGHTIVDLRTTHPPGPTLSERIHHLAEAHDLPIEVGSVGIAQMEAIAARAPDAVVCAGWPRLLPEPARFGLRGVNVHPSLLPDGRGPWPLPHVILKGLDRSGVSVHRLDHAFDTGPILAQRAFAVPGWFDLDDMLRRTRAMAAAVLVDCLADFDQRWADARPQGAGSWWPALTRADRTLDWAQPVAEVFRRARAFGRDGVFATIEGRARTLVAFDQAAQRGRPGAVLARGDGRLRIAALGGSIDFYTAD